MTPDLANTLTTTCPKDTCRIAAQGTGRPQAGQLAVYDKSGAPVYQDPNLTTETFGCLTCGAEWRVTRKVDGTKEVQTAREGRRDF